MKSLKISLLIFLLFFSPKIIFSQETYTDTESINEGSINDQFEFLLRKSGNFKGTNGQAYEAVKQSWLYALKSHTLDSLKTIRKDLNDTKAVVDKQAKEISNLKSKLTNTQNDLDKTNTEKDSMALFGLQMSKTNYNMLMWTIIAALLALLILFIYKFKNSNAITKQAKQNLAEIEEEFDEHRRVALEREQKVRRQLQDEINKQKGV
ncbi:tRNA (guanine-N1)-methyltransferase [Seonamhaeicola sediminis]|uniref:tRNA (Guanine-N1)-methyltransferase n=1 Tax=Seonamhaeicola sediminis TaxID=2528206 RepID=A0A562Y8Z5_9FLAO|nr:tRNA (guanine-N1)-methyltransferase [Seonamhaeicola sediminis]TWO30901.1 tRNA (guanine-N1)-methyltransferase [Seonamhaeicola sediminis]